MFQRKGASLLATIVTSVFGVGALGAVGYSVMNGGMCGSGCCGEAMPASAQVVQVCDEKAETTEVIAASHSEEGKSCCALGKLAEEAEVVAASNEKTSCASACDKPCGEKASKVVAASNAKASCASQCSKPCGDKGVQAVAMNKKASCASGCSKPCGERQTVRATVVQASYPLMMPAMLESAEADCGAKPCGGKAVQAVANAKASCASQCSKSCDTSGVQTIAAKAKKAACGSSCDKPCSGTGLMKMVRYMNWKVEPGIIAASYNAKRSACASSCDKPCGVTKAVQAVAANAKASCGASCSKSCGDKTAVQAASNVKDSGCCKGSGVRADGKACCGGCDKPADKKVEGEPVASAGE